MSLSDAFVRNLKAPKQGQKAYADDTLPGFSVRISQGGTKSFVLVHGKERQRITIGRYPIIDLKQARAEAKRLLAEFTLGKGRPNSITYQQAVERFLKEKAKEARATTVAGYKRLLARLKFKGALVDISHDDASRKLDAITAVSEQGHVLVAAKVFWNWCIKRRLATENPFTGLTKAVYIPRTRVLTREEIRALWRATAEDTPFHRVVRLCLLTAQRRGEIAQLREHYIKDDTCTLPAFVTKNGVEHTFPLGKMAQHLLSKLPLTNGYMVNSNDKVFSNWGDAKKTLDTKLGTAHFTIHDIRRTVATTMAEELKIAPHIIERLLNHITGSLSPIARTYNRAVYMPKMRAAIASWEQYLQTICAG